MINDWLNQFEKAGKAFVPFRSEGWQGKGRYFFPINFIVPGRL